MSIIRKARKGDAVYWAIDSTTQTGITRTGKPTYAEPIEIKVRWDDENELHVMPNGREFVSKATIMVDRAVDLGGAIRKGLLADVIDLENPYKNPNTFEIRKTKETPNLKYTETLYEAVI